MNDDMAERDSQWLADEFAFIYGPDWRETSDELKIQHGFIMMNQPQDDICIKQSATQGAPHVRPHAFCCLGPTETAPSQLIRRQDLHLGTITNWFNCDLDIAERPFCEFRLTARVCCLTHLSFPVGFPPGDQPDWWRWGFKGVDCVLRVEESPG